MDQSDFYIRNAFLNSPDLSDAEKEIIKDRFNKSQKIKSILLEHEEDKISLNECLDKIKDIDDNQCPHERSIFSNCVACIELDIKCNEIIWKINPEWAIDPESFNEE